MSESDPSTDGDPNTDSGADASADADAGTGQCAEPGCERPAAVRVHVPWGEDRTVCPAHGRALSAQDGVVAVPLDPDGRSGEWP